MKYYGNETNLGAHLPLNLCLANLHHRSAKEYVEKLTEWMSNLPTGAWSSWSVCYKYEYLYNTMLYIYKFHKKYTFLWSFDQLNNEWARGSL